MKTIKHSKLMTAIFVTAAFSISGLYAQDAPPETSTPATESGSSLEVGVRYMPTFSTFKLRQPDGSSLTADFETGHGFGGLVAFNITSIFGIQGEFIYSDLAQKYQSQGVERRVHLSYINIPVLFSLNTGKYRAINLNVVAGPQFGINVGGKAESTDAGDGQEAVHTVVAAKASDVGFAYGAGLDFGLGAAHRTRLGVGFRGVYGLVDISDNAANQVSTDYYILDRTHIETYAGYVSLSYLIK